jgi:subtilisin family serine protease
MKLSTVSRIFVSILLVVFVLSLASPAQTSPADGKVRVWVQFQPGQHAQVENALKGAGAQVHYMFDELNAFAVSVPAAALAGLERNPNVLLVEEDAPRFPISVMKSTVQAPAQVTVAGQTVPYGVDMVQARDVWDANRDGNIDSGAPTGATRKVCIIDSGFYTAHEDFQGVNVSGYNGNLPWNTDGDGHGSHVAGTIAAVNNALGVVGVTPGTVQLYIVRVFGNDGAWAYSSTLVDASNRCANAGANIISMSLGGTQSSRTERTAFDNHYAAGILPIAAAGNDGNTRTSYPAGYASVVSVAAIDSTKTVATFSQQNADVEIAAPGVSVLSTVPYNDVTTLTVDGVTYSGGHVEFSARGSASGALVNGGLCDSTGSWAGKVVLCERGVISFYDKVRNVQLGGGAAAVIYNNVSGGFIGTLGDGNSSTIVAISLSQEDGRYLVANKLGQTGAVSSSITQPASGYEYYDGTSMATPHVSAVAALIWSANTGWTNQQIRDAMNNTAEDLGAAGRDVAYGYGLVRAKAALDSLGGGGGGGTTNALSVTVATNKNSYVNRETVTITSTVKDQNTAAVASAAVSVTIKNAAGAQVASGTCTTGTSGTCSVTYRVDTRKAGTGTFTVTSVAAKSGYSSGTGSTTFLVQ